MFTRQELEKIQLLEDKIKKQSTIRFVKDKTFETVRDIVKCAIKTDTEYGGVEPTRNSKLNRIHKNFGSRTITDIYRIVLYYKPSTKLKEIYSILRELNKDKKLRSWNCSTIGRRVFRMYDTYYNNTINSSGITI